MEPKKNKVGSTYEELARDCKTKSSEKKNENEFDYIIVGDYIIDKELIPLIGRKKTETGEEEGTRRVMVDLVKKYSEYKSRLGDVTDKILYNAFDQLEYLFWEAEKHKKIQIRHLPIQDHSSRNVLKKTKSKPKHKQEQPEEKDAGMPEIITEQLKAEDKILEAEFTNYKMKFNILMSPSCFNDTGSLIEGTSYRLEFDKQFATMEKCPVNYTKGDTSIHFGQLKTVNSKYDVYLQSENLSSVLFVLGTAKRPKTGCVNVSLVRVTSYDVTKYSSKKELSFPDEISMAIKSESKIILNEENKSNIENGLPSRILTSLEFTIRESEKSLKKGLPEKKGNSLISKVFSLWRHWFGREKAKNTKIMSFNKSCISFGSKKEVTPSLKSKSEVNQAITSGIFIENRSSREKNKLFSPSASSISLLSVLGKQRQYRNKNKAFLPSDISATQY